MDRIDFALPRGSVIAGRITDELGEPMAGVRIDGVTLSVFADRRTAAQSVQSRRHVQHRHERSRRVPDVRPDAGYIRGERGSRRRGVHQHTRWRLLPPGPSSGDNDGYATIYYPGTLSADDAQTITVGVAEVVTAVFPLASVRLAKLSGTIRNSSGAPAAGARVTLRARDGFSGFYRGQPPTGSDGGFTIPNVPPGDYIVEARPGNIRPIAAESFEIG